MEDLALEMVDGILDDLESREEIRKLWDQMDCKEGFRRKWAAEAVSRQGFFTAHQFVQDLIHDLVTNTPVKLSQEQIDTLTEVWITICLNGGDR